MNTQLLILFIILSIVNVILNTIKSIITVNGGKFGAALINAITFFVYTYVIIYTNCELPMLTKAIITGVVNFIGVYIVKLVEEKMRKDKLWKIELTTETKYAEKLHADLESFNIPHNYITNVGKWTIFNCYCMTQKESAFVKEVCNRNHAKYFVSETKNL